MDLGNGTAAYSPASRNSTGDVQVGATTTGAVEANLGLNQGTLHYDPTLGFIFSANSGTGNANAGFTLMPEGTGNESSIVLCSSSTCSVGNYNSIQSFSTGLDLFGGSIITGDQYGNPHNTLDDGAGNMTVANKITAQQFCISSNCVSSLWSNPMSTLGDLLYGGASGAATRLAGNTSTTPMYLKSVGSGSTATAPALAQIQFSDIAGTLGISAGGTGQTTASAAFNALSPLTNEGDLHYFHSSSNTRLAIGGASTFLTSNGTDPSWGSLTGAGFGSQTANTFMAAPSGSSGNPSFRTLVAADLPSSITSNTSGNAATATALAATPTLCSGNNFATGVAASGNANCSQPAFNNLSGSLALSQTPLTTSGDLLYANSTPALARLPIGSANQFLGVSSGSPAWVQPSFSNLSGTVSTSQLPTVPVTSGGTGQTTAAAGFNALSPLSTEGDLLYYHSSANNRLGVGTNGACLTSNGTDPVWGSCSTGGFSNPMTTLGDLIYGGASGAATRLGGNSSSTKNFLISTGSSGAATAPLWGTIAASDLPGSGAATVNGQTCTLNSSCSVNNGAAQYSLTVNGAAGAVLGGVSPSSTSGVPLISQGSSANPVFGALNLAGGSAVVTGTLPTASFPALTGDTTNTAGSLATTTTGLHFGASNAVALPTSAPTSGGIPYFSSASAISSSAALTQYGVVVGGGAGGAPTSTAAGAANMPLIGQGSAAPIFSTIAYPTTCAASSVVVAASASVISCNNGLGTNKLSKGASNGLSNSSITDNATDVTTTEPLFAGNGVALSSATTITATTLTTTGLVLPTVPVSTTVRGRCDIIWQQATAVSTVTFGVGMNNAPTDLYVTPIIWTSTSGANVSPSPTTITSTGATAVTSTITPGAFGTNYHGEFIFTLMTGASNTVAVTLYGDTQTTGDALVIEPGSSCGWLP